VFKANATVFNIHRELVFTISDVAGIETSFTEHLFGSPVPLPAKISAPYAASLLEAAFTLNIDFSSDHQRAFEQSLRKMTI
jgi:hypothetical protein